MSTAEEKPTGEYRQYLPDLSNARFTTMKTQDAHEYAHAFKTKHIPPWLYALFEHWRDLYEEPYQGISTDGVYLCPWSIEKMVSIGHTNFRLA